MICIFTWFDAQCASGNGWLSGYIPYKNHTMSISPQLDSEIFRHITFGDAEGGKMRQGGEGIGGAQNFP